MDLTVIILSTVIYEISAFPFEPYSGVASANVQPVYWVSTAATSPPQVSSFYRDTPVAPAQPPTQYFANPVNVAAVANNPQHPTVGTPGFAWVRSGISATNQAMPSSEIPTAIPELKPQNSNQQSTAQKIAFTKPETTLVASEATKEKTKEHETNQVTIFAPGSFIEPNSIQAAFKKSFDESGISVFIYAPGSIFTTKGKDVLKKSPYLGPDRLAPESVLPVKHNTHQTISLATLLNSKSQLEEQSEILDEKLPENSKGTNKKKKENTDDEDSKGRRDEEDDD